MTPHGLCYCAACTNMARYLASAAAARRTHRLTEAERRRGAGEPAFSHRRSDVTMVRYFFQDCAQGWLPPERPSVAQAVAIMLRALVLQELLVTFSPPWEAAT